MPLDIYGHSLGRSAEAEQELSQFLSVNAAPQHLIEEHAEATYFPDAHCLYDRHGLRITNSQLWRDRTNRDHDTWPDNGRQRRDVQPVNQSYNESVIYMGVVFPHYGHFVLEGIARLWADAVIGRPTMKLMFSETHKGALAAGYVTEFLDALGISRDRIVTFSHPVRLRHVLVPHQSFYIPSEAYPNHVDLPRKVAERMLSAESTTLMDTPAYLSRSQFKPGVMANSRRITNEAKLEAVLREHGVAIYHPEQLTLSEQVRIVNKHRWLIGMRGSAFHTLLFSLAGSAQHTCIMYESGGPRVLANYCLVDAITGVNGHYPATLVRDPAATAPDDPNGTDWMIDVDLALAWLAQRGVVSSPRARDAYSRMLATLPVRKLIAHVAGKGDIANEADLKGGMPACGRAIEGFQIDLPGFPREAIQYRALLGDGTWSEWSSPGTFVGSRGKSIPLLGFAVRLTGEMSRSFECSYVGSFVGTPDFVTAQDAENCQTVPAKPLESLQIFIRYRDEVGMRQ